MILLPCTLAHLSSIPMGAMYLYMQEYFLHSLIRSYKHAGTNFNRDNQSFAPCVVTNNLTVIIKVVLIEGFLYILSLTHYFH